MYCRRRWFVRFLPSLSKFPFQTIKVRLDNLYCLFCKPLHCTLSIVLILTCRLIHFSTFAYVIYMNSIHVSRLCINNSLHLVQKYSCGRWAFASRHICSKVVESAVLKWLLYWKKKTVENTAVAAFWERTHSECYAIRFLRVTAEWQQSAKKDWYSAQPLRFSLVNVLLI